MPLPFLLIAAAGALLGGIAVVATASLLSDRDKEKIDRFIIENTSRNSIAYKLWILLSRTGARVRKKIFGHSNSTNTQTTISEETLSWEQLPPDIAMKVRRSDTPLLLSIEL